MCFGSKNDAADDGDQPPRPAPPPQKKSSPPPSRIDGDGHTAGANKAKSGTYSEPPNRAAEAGGGPSRQRDEYAPPPGPPPGPPQPPQSSSQGHDGIDYAPPSGPPPGRREAEYEAPSGPPPGHRQYQQQAEYAPPPGPPPSSKQPEEYAPPSGPPPPGTSQDYAPPPGPPPASDDWAAPPPGPPPSDDKSAPKHDWEVAVPDTTLFPPPPAIFSGFDRSPTSNASEEEAIAGEEWCERYPLMRPMDLDQAALSALQSSNIRLMEPAGFNGKLNWLKPGHWEGSTVKNSPDRCIIGYPPLYVVNQHDPTRFGKPKTIYYEVKLRPDSRTVFVGLGFTALPYPSFRMPGWHRGSLAVHGDDGHKYINDRWGGKDFTAEFRRGDTYGVGMTLSPPGDGGPRPQVDIFFTKNGKHVGGWDLHEETDAEQDLPVTGLEGFHDLSCAIGTYDGVGFEAIFDPARWLYKDLP